MESEAGRDGCPRAGALDFSLALELNPELWGDRFALDRTSAMWVGIGAWPATPKCPLAGAIGLVSLSQWCRRHLPLRVSEHEQAHAPPSPVARRVAIRAWRRESRCALLLRLAEPLLERRRSHVALPTPGQALLPGVPGRTGMSSPSERVPMGSPMRAQSLLLGGGGIQREPADFLVSLHASLPVATAMALRPDS
jgi:hypothetical protein